MKPLLLLVAALLLAVPASARPVAPPAGAAQLCQEHAWACSAEKGRITSSASVLSLAKSVNQHVNKSIVARSDVSVHGQAEKWTLPRDAGDCEDFALLKMKMLVDAGVGSDRLRLAQVMARGVPSHVVLIVSAGDRDYLLDNLSESVAPRSSSRYVFLKVQRRDQPGGWEAGI